MTTKLRPFNKTEVLNELFLTQAERDHFVIVLQNIKNLFLESKVGLVDSYVRGELEDAKVRKQYTDKRLSGRLPE